MAACTRCGRTTSIWQRGFLSGLCPQCSRQPATDAREIMALFEKKRSLSMVLLGLAVAAVFLGWPIELAVIYSRQTVPARAIEPPETSPPLEVFHRSNAIPSGKQVRRSDSSKLPEDLRNDPRVRRALRTNTDHFPFFLIGAVVAAAALSLLHLVNWKCPACGRSLGRSMSPKFCSQCGVQLQDAEDTIQGRSATGPNQTLDQSRRSGRD